MNLTAFKVTPRVRVSGSPWRRKPLYPHGQRLGVGRLAGPRADLPHRPADERGHITIGKGGSVCVDPHDHGVWVSNEVDGSATKLDPATSRIVDTVGVRGPDGLEWIPNQGDGTVSLIDPASNSLPFVVREGFGSMWVDNFKGRSLARYQP